MSVTSTPRRSIVIVSAEHTGQGEGGPPRLRCLRWERDCSCHSTESIWAKYSPDPACRWMLSWCSSSHVARWR